MDVSEQLSGIADDGRLIAAAARAGLDARVESCPEWSGRDLLAHVDNFFRIVLALIAAGGAESGLPAPADPAEADRSYDADLARLVDTLRHTRPDAPVHNWSVTPHVAAFWTRRAVHELAVHRWDAETIGGGTPAPIPAGVAVDGIAEFFDVFVATGLAAGMVPPTATTLVLEITDTGDRIEHHLPDPGPVTTVRGTASDLLLGLWRRRDPLTLHAGGDPAILEAWPTI